MLQLDFLQIHTQTVLSSLVSSVTASQVQHAKQKCDTDKSPEAKSNLKNNYGPAPCRRIRTGDDCISC